MRFTSQQRADLALVLVSLLWGITFPLIRSALADLRPVQFVAYRFALATVAFLPLVLTHAPARAALRRALGPGLLLGFIAWTSYYSQTIGLRTTPAGRAAFITGTSVILVPLLSPLFRAGRPSRVDLLAAVVATAGLYLMTGASTDGTGLNRGDLYILLCAFTYAIYIHVLQKMLVRRHQELALAFTQILCIGLYGAIVLGLEGDFLVAFGRRALIALVVCALLATVGCFWLQTRYQGRTTPQRVALIFSLEPVFATIFAFYLLDERIGGSGLAGAALILAAVIGAETYGRGVSGSGSGSAS